MKSHFYSDYTAWGMILTITDPWTSMLSLKTQNPPSFSGKYRNMEKIWKKAMEVCIKNKVTTMLKLTFTFITILWLDEMTIAELTWNYALSLLLQKCWMKRASRKHLHDCRSYQCQLSTIIGPLSLPSPSVTRINCLFLQILICTMIHTRMIYWHWKS